MFLVFGSHEAHKSGYFCDNSLFFFLFLSPQNVMVAQIITCWSTSLNSNNKTFLYTKFQIKEFSFEQWPPIEEVCPGSDLLKLRKASIFQQSVTEQNLSGVIDSDPSPDHVFSIFQSQTSWFSKKSQPVISSQTRERYKGQRLKTGPSKALLSPEADVILSFDTLTAQGFLCYPF